MTFFILIFGLSSPVYSREKIKIHVQSHLFDGKELISCEAPLNYLNKRSRKDEFLCQYEKSEIILHKNYKSASLMIVDPVLSLELKKKFQTNENFETFPLLNICNSLYSHNCLQGVVFLTKKGSGIEKIEDFKDKELGVDSQFSSLFLLSLYELKRVNLTSKELRFLYLESPERIAEEIYRGKINEGVVRAGLIEQYSYPRLQLPLNLYRVHLIQEEVFLSPIESFTREIKREKFFLLGLLFFFVFIFSFVLGALFFLYRKNKQYRLEIEEINHLLEDILQEKSSSLKRTTELLRIEMKKLEGIVESIDSGLAIVDDKNKILKINQAFQKIFRKSLFNILGKEIKDIFIDNTDNKNIQNTNILHQATFNLKVTYNLENEIKYLELKKVPLLKEGLYLVIVRDITHQKKWEEELTKYSQLETLRVVASGLAHDLNNLLGAILNNIELVLLKSRHSIDIETKDKIENIKEICLRAKSLTQELLIYGKNLILSVNVYSLKKFLEEIVQFSLAGSGIKVIYSFDHRAQYITGDRNLLSIVIHNIIINAREAMKDRGILRITTELRKPYLIISISDSGPGIPPENLKKLFTPFFTTKPGGSGLGLFSAKRIIDAHNGKIEVESTLGKGTTVRVCLPYVEEGRPTTEEVKTETDRLKIPEILGGRKLKILLMDDEKEIRESLKDLLEAFEYEVTPCENGEEAIALLRKDTSYDVAVLDLTVPGQYDGIRTFLELRKINPDLKGILATGYAYKRETVDAKAMGFEEVLIKPFTIEALLTVLEKISSRKDTNS